MAILSKEGRLRLEPTAPRARLGVLGFGDRRHEPADQHDNTSERISASCNTLRLDSPAHEPILDEPSPEVFPASTRNTTIAASSNSTASVRVAPSPPTNNGPQISHIIISLAIEGVLFVSGWMAPNYSPFVCDLQKAHWKILPVRLFPKLRRLL